MVMIIKHLLNASHFMNIISNHQKVDIITSNL